MFQVSSAATWIDNTISEHKHGETEEYFKGSVPALPAGMEPDISAGLTCLETGDDRIVGGVDAKPNA